MEEGDWPQAVIEFADRQTAEQVSVAHLRPALAAAQVEEVIAGWWFVRKTPFWKLRYLPADRYTQQRLAQVLDRLADEGQILGWATGIYEPEVRAFGGAAGMDVAHDLFRQDSRHVLDYLARQETAAPGSRELGRRELGVLLCSVLMRGAGQDWFEQGDVWSKLAAHRPPEHPDALVERSSNLIAAVSRLMTVNVSPTSSLVNGGPLSPIADWIAAFETAGQQLAELALRGTLERGLRAVLAHHTIFHWNRLGLTYAEQNTLATLTSEVVMGNKDDAASPHTTRTGRTTVGDMPTETTKDLTAVAERLRNELVDQLAAQGSVRTERVETAMRNVPRELFVPHVPLEQAYADSPIYTKDDGEGISISAASQPTIVAMQLEQLQVEPGQRVLEAGAGTGLNAGYLGHLVGDDGLVITIDVDEDIVEGARSGLAAAGCENVRVILGDGAVGYAEGAPYDRIIATVGVGDLPPAWLEQLAPDGLLVAPMRLRGSVSRSIVFELDNGHLRSRSSAMSTFMPLRRGIADDPRRVIPLTTDGTVTLQLNQEQTVDASALIGVLDQPRSEVWTGVLFGGSESFEWLDLWLTCTMDNALSRMTTDRSTVERGLVTPQFGWGAMATAHKGDLAYLTLRPAAPVDGDETGKKYEVGVIGHGPGGDELARQVEYEIRTWDRDYRSRPVQFEIEPADGQELITAFAGQFTFDRPRTRLSIRWE